MSELFPSELIIVFAVILAYFSAFALCSIRFVDFVHVHIFIYEIKHIVTAASCRISQINNRNFISVIFFCNGSCISVKVCFAVGCDKRHSRRITVFNVGVESITMAYATEFNELESTAGEFKSISLTGYLAGVLSLISKSLINNSQFDIVSVVIERMAVSVSRWIEKELLFGTKDKMEGLSEIWRQGLSARDTQPPALRTGSLTRPYLKKRRQTGKRKPMQPRSRRGKPRKQ